MTREEAIKQLKKLKGNTGINELSRALNIAIKALEQEPCEDCISRQALLEKAIDIPIAKIVTDDEAICRKIVFADDIENMPSVTPQPKIGHWIYTLEDWNRWQCSECGFTEITDIHVHIGYKYCPSCGAKMIKREVEK